MNSIDSGIKEGSLLTRCSDDTAKIAGYRDEIMGIAVSDSDDQNMVQVEPSGYAFEGLLDDRELVSACRRPGRCMLIPITEEGEWKIMDAAKLVQSGVCPISNYLEPRERIQGKLLI